MKNLIRIIVLLLVCLISKSNYSIDDFKNKTNHDNRFSKSFQTLLVNSYFNREVRIYKFFKNFEDYGQIAWLSRSSQKIKVKYFASGKAYSKYISWKNSNINNKVILVCSGAYSDAYNPSAKPVGLTVDNGFEVNKTLVTDLDGLAIVYATGGIVVSNLDEGNLYIKTLDRKIDIQKNGFDMQRFMLWSKSEFATVFQTNLLAWKNYISFTKSNSEQAIHKDPSSRRLLGLVKDINGNIYYVVFNLTKPLKLWDASNEALDYIKEQNGMELIALLNLDTGYYDCLSVFDEKSKQLDYMKGTQNTTFLDTSNLLIFYREE